MIAVRIFETSWGRMGVAASTAACCVLSCRERGTGRRFAASRGLATTWSPMPPRPMPPSPNARSANTCAVGGGLLPCRWTLPPCHLSKGRPYWPPGRFRAARPLSMVVWPSASATRERPGPWGRRWRGTPFPLPYPVIVWWRRGDGWADSAAGERSSGGSLPSKAHRHPSLTGDRRKKEARIPESGLSQSYQPPPVP